MKKFLLLIFLILLGGSIYFLMSNSKSSSANTPKYDSLNRSIVELTPLNQTKNNDLKSTYRIFSKGDSMLFFSEKGTFAADPLLNRINKVNLIGKAGDLYYYHFQNDTTTFFNSSNGIVSVIPKTDTINFRLSGAGNVIYSQGKIFYDSVYQSSSSHLVFLTEKDIATKKTSVLVQLNSLLKDKIQSSDCLGPTLEGNFFPISKEAWIYLFYRGGYFLLYRNGKISLHQTIDKSQFIPFVKKETNVGGYQVSQCAPKNSNSDLHINYSAFCKDDKLYILSGVIVTDKTKSMYAPVDVYDVNTMIYKRTFKLPLGNTSTYAYVMGNVGDYFYLYSADNTTYVYKLPEE